MPIYEYRCTHCGHELEALQKLAEPPLTRCPACHRDALAKRVSAAGFQLKGSGWYATDFKGSGSKPPAAPEGAAKPGAEKASGGDAALAKEAPAADAKPDAKPTTPSSSGGK